jgi:hypothetical protein
MALALAVGAAGSFGDTLVRPALAALHLPELRGHMNRRLVAHYLQELVNGSSSGQSHIGTPE